jgi:hypothetical protein
VASFDHEPQVEVLETATERTDSLPLDLHHPLHFLSTERAYYSDSHTRHGQEEDWE